MFEPDFESDWDEEDPEDRSPMAPPWRRPLLIAIAAVTAVSLAIVPIAGLFDGPSVADNGLEVCGYDYCVVREAVSDAGLDATMGRLANTFVSAEEAEVLVDRLVDYLREAPVDLLVVERLDGRIGGVFDASERTIYIEIPVSVWTVVHEVAHVAHSGHDEAFQATVIELAALFDEPA